MSTLELLSTDLFHRQYDTTARTEPLELSYMRARVLARHHALTPEDVLQTTPKFWRAHMDPIILNDITAQVLFSIQSNLVAGTIALHALYRPDLEPLLARILHYDVSATFMLNEIDHGCDARNLETTAILQPDGGFILQSPTRGAAKFMPPSMPVAGIPRIGIVFARLVVDGEDRGIRGFVVSLNDGRRMCRGVTSRLLPPIAAGRVLDHAVTSFDHVRLPASALLGELDKPSNMRVQFLSAIQRVGFGTLALTMGGIPFMKCAAYLGGKYSLRRMVQGADGRPVPIISFRTQQIAVLHALAHATVMVPFTHWITARFSDIELGFLIRHGLGVILKATYLHHGQASLAAVIERCGAQGLFKHNQLVELEAMARANGIAEGDVLVLCIRLATELLIGRYSLPEANRPECLLAQHERGYREELRVALKQTQHLHRSEEYNSQILPRCRPFILAMGHRMAYEAALNAGIDADLLALYEAGMVSSDSSWYSEHLGLKRSVQYDMERRAMDGILPRLDKLLDELEIAPYCNAPFETTERWDAFVQSMPSYTADSSLHTDKGKKTVPARL